MKTICVYCGASKGNSPHYATAARALAKALVAQQLNLVYGGGNIGLMGILADEVLQLGGQVTGVIPQALLDMEVGHLELTQLHVVKDMHERKALMADLSDGFIALPGGIGTLEELIEIVTWKQLGFHQKPIGILNVDGYFDGLLAFLNHTVDHGFLSPAHRRHLLVASQPEDLLTQFQTHQSISAT